MKSAILLLIICCAMSISAQQKNSSRKKASPGISSSEVSRLIEGQKSYFIENRGQWDSEARFLAQQPGLNAWLTDEGIVYDFYRIENKPAGTSKASSALLGVQKDQAKEEQWKRGHVVRMKFTGASPAVSYDKGSETGGYYNYLIGSDRSKWASHVRRYESVTMQNIYEGIDARLYFDGSQLRYDMIVAPGADPKKIGFVLEGAERVKVDGNGDLVFRTQVGEVAQGKLYAYQERKGKRERVPCSFVVKEGRVSFAVKGYDRSRALIIDPLIYSTLIGGNKADEVYAIATRPDETGSSHVYIAGATSQLSASMDFPVKSPIFYYDRPISGTHCFISRFSMMNSRDQDLVHSTIIGWNKSDQVIVGLAVDTAGTIYAAGNTSYTELVSGYLFPSNVPGYRKAPYPVSDPADKGDIFLVKVKADGSDLLAATFFGSSGFEYVKGLALDRFGYAYITGVTYSVDFERSAGAKPAPVNLPEAFISKIRIDSGFVYSRMMGGGRADVGNSIAVDSLGNAYVTGTTSSDDFPTTPNALFPARRTVQPPSSIPPPPIDAWSDAFVYKMKADGSGPVYSTYFGGDSTTSGLGITVDKAGNAYFCGRTHAISVGVRPMPVTAGAFSAQLNGGTGNAFRDGYVAKLNPQGTGPILFCTYIGGAAEEFPTSITLDPGGNIYVAGVTHSSNFPKPGYSFPALAYQKTLNGGQDAFALRMSNDGTAVSYASYLGGSGIDSAKAICTDIYGDLYIAGTTNSKGLDPATRFPVTRNAYDTTFAGTSDSMDVFVSRMRMGAGFGVDAGAAEADVCLGDSLQVTATVSNKIPGSGYPVAWRNAAGTSQTISEPAFPTTWIKPSATGKYYVTVTDSKSGFTAMDSVLVRVNPRPVSGVKQRVIELCRGRDTVIGAAGSGGTGSLVYSWTSSVSGSEIDNPNVATPRVRPVKDTTKYYLRLSDGKSCAALDSVEIRLRPELRLASPAELDFGELSACRADTVMEFMLQNTGTGAAKIASVQSVNTSFVFVSAGSSASPQFTIAQGGSVAVKLRFAPGTSGDAAGTVRFVSDPCGEGYSIAVKGRKLQSSVAMSRTAVDMGIALSCDTEEKTDSVYIYNRGVGVMTLEDPAVDAPFTASIAKKSVGEGDSALVRVRFAANAEGVYQKDLRLSYTSKECASFVSVQLRGEYQKPAIVSEAEIALPALSGCESSYDTVIVVRNTGTSAVTVTGVSKDASVKFMTANIFPLAAKGSAGDSRSIPVRFEPASTGSVAAQVTFTFAPCDDSITVTVRGSKEGINLTAADTVDFGDLVLCSQTTSMKSLSVFNGSGTAGARVKSVTLVKGAGIFVPSVKEGDLLPAGETKFGMEFTPAGEGVYEGELSLVLEPCDRVETVYIRGRGVQPKLELVSAAQFGISSVGAKVVARAVIRNSGTTSLRVTMPTGGDLPSLPFELLSTKPVLPAEIAAGGELELELRYTATAGVQHDTVVVRGTDPCAVSLRVPLMGEGSEEQQQKPAKIRAGLGRTAIMAAAGDRVVIPVSILWSENLQSSTATSFTAELRFNKNTLKPLGSLVSNTVAGSDRVIRVSGSRIDTAGRLLDVEFLAMLGDVACSAVELTSIEFTGGDQDLVTEREQDSAVFCLSDLCDASGVPRLVTTGGGAFLLEGSVPNPASGASQIEFSLAEAGHAELAVVDMMGRELLRLVSAELGRGRHSIGFDASELPSGIYLVVLRSNADSLTRTLQVLK